MNRPENFDYKSVLNFMEKNGTPQLCEDESEFILHKEDLITLRPGREDAWLDRVVEKTLRLLPTKFAEVSLSIFPNFSTN